LDATYAFIFRHAAEGILVINHYNDLLHINPAAVGMLAVDAEACMGRPVKEIFANNPPLLRLCSLGGTEKTDIRLPKDRLATGIAQDLDGRRVVLLHDVTEQRELDSRREALVRRIAHDLRNPLNALAGYANLVEKSGVLTPLQGKFLTRIQQTTTKLYEMAAKLVDLSWIEAGMPLEYVPVELTSLTREVMRELSTDAQQRGISIVNSIPNELPPVMGDPKRLKQVIFNLLDNAIRYSLDGMNVVIHAWHQDDEVFYTVADQGLGIAEDEVDKIWDRMWRSSDDRIRDIPGGGIGLSFARIIIQRHGGAVWAESDLGEGSTFSFRLPLTRGG